MAARIRLRTGQFRKYCNLAGLKTDQAKADAIGVNASTLSRILRGDTAPGERFIAGVLHAFADYELDFADLFEVIDDSPVSDQQVPA